MSGTALGTNGKERESIGKEWKRNGRPLGIEEKCSKQVEPPTCLQKDSENDGVGLYSHNCFHSNFEDRSSQMGLVRPVIMPHH